MFERFVRLARARKALKDGQLEQAARLAEDPLVASHRRAVEIRAQAIQGLLERARRRLSDGKLGAALGDASRVLALQPDVAGARTLVDDLKQRLGDVEQRRDAARQMLGQARGLAEQGRLDAASRLHQEVRDLQADGVDALDLEAFIARRRERAAEHVRAAEQRFAAGEVDAAMAELQRGKALDGEAATGSELPGELGAVLARKLTADARGLLAERNWSAAHGLLEAVCTALPELADAPAARKVARAIADGRRAELLAELQGGDPAVAARAFLEADPRMLALPALSGEVAAAQAIARGADLRNRGAFGAAADCFDEAHGALKSARLAQESRELRKRAAHVEKAIREARALSAGGRLTDARAGLIAILEECPMHESVRRELEVLDQGAVDREKRLTAARELAREGKLREASAVALTLAVPGAAGEDARLLLKDLQARMDLVAAGLDQVRSALHGRDAATTEGVRHCLRRLEELAKVQTDHEDLARVTAALEAELTGMEQFDRARADLDGNRVRAGAEGLTELAGLRARLLHADRLDARILDLADTVATAAEEALLAGRLEDADACLLGLTPAVAAGGDLGQKVESLRSRVQGNREQAEALAAQGAACLRRREPDEAQRLLFEARNLWLGGPGGRRLEDELRKVRTQERVLAQVEDLAREEDFAGAERRLGDMPPTPAALRTRIFDMKQGLARAQGLGGGFVLRVDEGGEYLVLRGDSLSIGNVRAGQADLPILANIAGCHARIQRTMSFHGGMQDRIVGDGGPLLVRGRPCSSHRLQDGDSVQLGSNLRIAYAVPSPRSLTARLTLLGGFQVAGTDRVLLMKDRGRDGRILLGPGKDNHVHVDAADGEVEIFATKNGQVRVRCEGEGTMDGKPFRGEHPIEAGATVECRGVSFVLLPWNKSV